MAVRIKDGYILRRNGNKILILPRNVRSFETNRYVIHPTVAIVLSLINNEGTIERARDAVSVVFGTTEKQAHEMVETVRNNLAWVFEETDVPGNPVDPARFVVNSDDVDLDTLVYRYPTTVSYITTYQCRRKCIYCYAYHGRDGRLLPLDKFISVLDEGVEHGLDTIILSGGEPFCHPWIFNLIKATVDRGISCFTSTKLELSDADVGNLANTGLRQMQMSLDSHIPRIADLMAGAEDCVGATARTAQRLRENGFKILSNTVVTAYNLETASDTVEFLVSIGCSDISLSVYGRSLWSHSDEFFASEEALLVLNEEVAALRKKHPGVLINYSYTPDPKPDQVDLRRKVFEGRSRCTAGREGVIFLPDGRVSMCEMIPQEGDTVVGDLNTQSLLEIWQSSALKDMILPKRDKFVGTPCAMCADFLGCHLGRGRCLRNAIQCYDSLYAPDPMCPLAPPGRRLR